ncbi:hypothetical protein ACFQDN_25950 [Pseudomonas asuensis]
MAVGQVHCLPGKFVIRRVVFACVLLAKRFGLGEPCLQVLDTLLLSTGAFICKLELFVNRFGLGCQFLFGLAYFQLSPFQ